MGASVSTIIEAYRTRIDRYVGGLLDAYVARLEMLPAGSVQAKEFNDNVWGTISLQPAEVLVLDSPLLQRLRRVRQLGVAQWVYPGANHTRLEHSLGVCAQVQRLTQSINAHATSEQYGELPETWVQTLRMAGLCHDVGHGLMSHVVENALARDDQCVDLILEFQNEVEEKESESQLSEIAAYFMLRSPAFGRLIAQAQRIAQLPVDPAFHQRVADCVIGVSNDQMLPLIHEVISGPFDCDKLDYMTRDAIMCGVPIVTDVTRLVQKVRAAKVRTDLLPDEIARVVEDKGGTHLVVAVARSGASTLHEVSLARSLMHDKIYRHHKVRATEAMVAGVVSAIGDLIEPYTPMLPFALTDDEFLALDAAAITRLAGTAVVEERRVAAAADLAERMRDRRLFVRSFAFAQKMPFDPYRDDTDQRRAIESLIRDSNSVPHRAKLVEDIVSEVDKILTLTHDTAVLDPFPERDIRPYLWIDPPKTDAKDAESDQSRAYLIEDDRRLVTMGQVSAETRGWADAYINVRDLGYVFCARELAPYVHIATEVVLRTTRGILFPRPMHSYAKVAPASVDGLRARLASAGYFDKLPGELGPTPAFLNLEQTKRIIAGQVERLGGYAGPASEPHSGKASGGALNEGKIRNWLTQFPSALLPQALELVRGTLLIDRNAINGALSNFFATPGGKPFQSGAIVPAGAPKDGSSILAYFAGDIAEATGCLVLGLPDALSTDRPIIFVDDIIGRGSSLISIFENYLGAPDTQNLGEARGEPLAEHAQAQLQSRPIAIVTAAARSGGLGAVQARLAELGVEVEVYADRMDAGLPTMDSVLSGFSEDDRNAFVSYCREIGHDLVRNRDKADDRALGYGNEGYLIVSAFNTPTMTLTPMWAAGDTRRSPWRPLFPRRSKH